MKGRTIIYWIVTLPLCAFMAFNAYAYLTRAPQLMQAFASLGYPAYFPTLLGVAKLLGVIALLVPGLPRLKEWAYAGFTFTFLGAIWSHLAMQQGHAVFMPALCLILLAVSCRCRPADRRWSASRVVEVVDASTLSPPEG